MWLMPRVAHTIRFLPPPLSLLRFTCDTVSKQKTVFVKSPDTVLLKMLHYSCMHGSFRVFYKEGVW